MSQDNRSLKLNDLTVEGEFLRIGRELYTPSNLEFKTDLKDSEIKAIAVLLSTAEFMKNAYGINVDVKNLVREFMALRVSLSRKGREELVRILATVEQERENLVKKLLGV